MYFIFSVGPIWLEGCKTECFSLEFQNKFVPKMKHGEKFEGGKTAMKNAVTFSEGKLKITFLREQHILN